MSVFLLQVSGEESNHKETNSNCYWEEPIKEGFYINYNWTGARREDWEKVKEDDRVIIYCTGTVKPYPKQISHTGEVQKVQFTEGKAVMEITIKELNPTIPLEIIGEKVDLEKLSSEMRNCGRRGFNICEVRKSDLEEIQRKGPYF